jgi:hypothetical protein
MLGFAGRVGSRLSERLFGSRRVHARRCLQMRRVVDKYAGSNLGLCCVFFFGMFWVKRSMMNDICFRFVKDADCSLFMQQLLTNGTELLDEVLPNEW